MIKPYTDEEIRAALDFRISRILNGLCNRLIRQDAGRRLAMMQESSRAPAAQDDL